MKPSVTILSVLLILACFAFTTHAQTPYVAVYFDEALTQEAMTYPGNCPPFGTVDTLFVAAQNVNDFMAGIEYSIHFGNNVVWLADFDVPPVTIGISPTGISMGWALPQNGYFPILTQKVLVQWVCQGCIFTNDPIRVMGHPVFAPNPQATRWPDVTIFDLVGLTSLTCPTIPADESTWGQVKALFAD